MSIDGKVFASKAKKGEIADFPDIERGWGVTEGTGYIPPMEYFNALGNRTDKNINELNKIKANLTDLDVLLPAGTIIQSASQSTPMGYLKCNGASISRVSYQKLFEVIGTAFGSDDENTFRLPDLRGRFIRGFSDGSSIDSGRAFGSSQDDAIRNITGSFSDLVWQDKNIVTRSLGVSGVFTRNSSIQNDAAIITGNSRTIYSGGDATSFDASKVVPTADDNRPYNIALNFYIKY